MTCFFFFSHSLLCLLLFNISSCCWAVSAHGTITMMIQVKFRVRGLLLTWRFSFPCTEDMDHREMVYTVGLLFFAHC
ncbi:hypothetical protein F4775DRAFT_543731 [Biscogniauxia sp. FL1348]|nr:hypothetical protein F4775DRAFT_543731 [Biscogniauxia sp. FL1348]